MSKPAPAASIQADPLAIKVTYTRPASQDHDPKHQDMFRLVSNGLMTDLHTAFESVLPQDVAFYVGQKDEVGRTLLHYACYLDLQNIVLYLLKLGANPYEPDGEGRNCYHALAYRGNHRSLSLVLNYKRHEMRQRLFEDLKEMKKAHGMKSLSLAGDSNKMLTASLEADLEIKMQKTLFDVDLEAALRRYYVSVVDGLRQACEPDQHQRNPLHYGAMARFTWCFKCVEMLLGVENLQGLQDFLQVAKDIQDLEWRQDRQMDPKKYLLILKDVQATLPKVLFRKRLSEFRQELTSALKLVLNAHDSNVHTPLHIAAYVGQYNCVRLFIEKGADKTHKGSSGTALTMAGTKLVMRYLTSLEESAANGDAESYKHLINSGYSANESKNEFLTTSMHKAVLQRGEALRTVLECEGDVNTIEWNIYTPLHYAAYYGNYRDAEVLILNGANVNALSNYKYTPMHLAALKDQHEIVRLLADNQSNTEARDHYKCTPLLVAAKKGGINSVKYLLMKGCDLYAIDYRGWNALHYAVFNRISHTDHVAVAEELVRFDSDQSRLISMLNSQSRTPIALAQGDNMKQAFKTLWKAAAEGDLDQGRLIVRKGVDVNMMTEKNRCTPLMLAVKRNRVLMVKFLLEQKASAAVVDADGKSALQYAQEFDPRICVLTELVEAENAKDPQFKAKLTPLTAKRLSKLQETLHVAPTDFTRRVLEETAKNQKILRAMEASVPRQPPPPVAASSRITDLQASSRK